MSKDNELIIDGQNAIQVKGNQRSIAFEEGLRRLMTSPELRERLGNSGPNSVTGYSTESICDKWEELLNK